MGAADLRDHDDRTAAGRAVADLYCPRCDEYSGGGLCRRCERIRDMAATSGVAESVIFLCSRNAGQGCLAFR